MNLTQYGQLNKQQVRFYEFMVENRQVSVSELAANFTQYGARRKEVCEVLGCTCKTFGNGRDRNCKSEEHIFSIVTYKRGKKLSTWKYEGNSVHESEPETLPQTTTPEPQPEPIQMEFKRPESTKSQKLQWIAAARFLGKNSKYEPEFTETEIMQAVDLYNQQQEARRLFDAQAETL